MVKPQFVHLHNHTEYSLNRSTSRILDRFGRPSGIVKQTVDFGMPAVAITDKGNMYGVIEFYCACRDIGVKPIIGCEIYLPRMSQVTLLAENNEGYRNLMHIVTSSNLDRDGFVDKEFLAQYSKGLICLSGGLNGEIEKALLCNNRELADKWVEEYKSIFGNENFYLEIMDNGIVEQKTLIPLMIDLGKRTNTPLVVTNNCHYLSKEDAFSHDVLLCIGESVTVDNPKRLKFPTDEFYYKSPEEMVSLFSYLPEAVNNTVKIADRCNVEIEFNKLKLPDFEVPAGETPESYLKHLCYEGLKKRYPAITQEIVDRIEHELAMINKSGLASLFLMVWDFVKNAKVNNIPVGPGRGAAASSLVLYSLEITNICPVKYGLIFERFFNPERHLIPDLDIDFAGYRRDEVIDYIRRKYGKNNVAQIIVFASLHAKLVIKDIARAIGFPVTEVDGIAKLIPFETSIFQSINTIPELNQLYKKDERVKRLLDVTQKLEGLKGFQGLHGAGLVIANDEITNFTPLTKTAKKDVKGKEITITQHNDDTLIKLGLIKIDLLNLQILTIIQDTIKFINDKTGKRIDLDKIPLDDRKTFNLLKKAETTDIFSLGAGGMKDFIIRAKPNMFEEIIAIISLYRPGPMGSGMLDEFILCKCQKTKIKYDHPLLEPILKETYGLIVYQEQVMRIAMELAGFTAGQADIFRSVMGKKINEEIIQQEALFLSGALKNNINGKISKKIFDQLVQFGGYGFNKAHAVSYALLAYQSAYLKANYPKEHKKAIKADKNIHKANQSKYSIMENKDFYDLLDKTINNILGFDELR